MDAQQFDDLMAAISALDAKVSVANGYLSSTSQAAVTLPGTQETIVDQLGDILSAMASSGSVAVPDYSVSMEAICKMLAYTDMLLLILLVMIALFLGVFLGNQVTKWLRARKAE